MANVRITSASAGNTSAPRRKCGRTRITPVCAGDYDPISCTLTASTDHRRAGDS